MKKINLLLILIFLQLLIISYLTFQIIKKSKNILGAQNINPIKKEDLIFPEVKNLKYFYEPKPNTIQQITKDWLPYSPKYTFNKDALNERFNYPVKKHIKTYRIITLGDSFTFGQNVSTEKNWTELLENKLNKKLICKNINKFEIINLAVYGYDTQYNVERFKLRGKKYNPDLVIWTFTDYERILEKMMPLIKKYENQAEELEKKGLYYQNWLLAREKIKEEIGEIGFVNHIKEQFNFFNNIYKKKLLLVSFPHKEKYVNILKEFAINRPQTFFFMPLINWEEKQYFLPDNHLNELGHQKIAEEIFNCLIKNEIVPCD